VIVIGEVELAGGDYFISDCEDCVILLQGKMGALRMEQIRRCKVMTGPVMGGCYIEHAYDTQFQLAVHQFRLHHTERCDFYLRARSNPIIEDCDGLRFAPYTLEYPGVTEQLDQEALGEADCGDKWCNIQDFKWLRQQQSPHWSVLPELERSAPQPAGGV